MYRVIIADDEPLVRSGLYYLTDWNAMGFEVMAVLEDGREVLDFLEEESVDVLLLDICMFQVSGLEVAAVVRDKYPKTRVVLLSGYQEFEYAREAMRQRVYEYLLKPIDDMKLQEVFSAIKAELDAEMQEEELIKNFPLERYELIAGTTFSEKEKDDRIYRACKYINSHLSDEFTCRDVAESINISMRHFTRLFRSEMGETFTDYVVRMRIEAAKRLLDESVLKIKDIPAAVGYIDEKYFYRLFKKQVGCSLREYRNRKNESQ